MSKLVRRIVSAADRGFFLITAIVLFQLCHVSMNWFFAGLTALAYLALFFGRYSGLDNCHASSVELQSDRHEKNMEA